MGTKNYTSIEINSLLYFVSKTLPLEYQEWAVVANQYAAWQSDNETPVRDMQSLKAKFDKLVNTKKPTGSPECPPTIQRAKYIAKSVQCRCIVASLGVANSSENESYPDNDSDRTVHLVNSSGIKEEHQNHIVVQKSRSRLPGANGIKMRQEPESLVKLRCE